MSMWSVAWLGWIAAFVALETPALLNKSAGDTFSAHVWKWAGIKGRGPLVKVRRTALLLGLAWLVTHFLTGGWV
ncbi:hypothetical protein SNA_36270 [Streptomyces natalensis ATCC 27448]|uniref:Integral membrane protein n=2 Tax=Streptomyces natalensis TaxID=68242 RepID=A0A0D7CGH0_9ACTN|nr:hypothetical protein SNA_36270 [Streptomyces natalensis ATCC 27448]